ncbi:glycosyltransferase family 2 protein [Vibrio parahaemolyticus]
MNKKITIALCTNNRPQLLKMAINSLSKIIIPECFIVDFILVDNDIKKSGLETFNDATRSLPFKSTYYLENEKGITFARNRALHEASKKDADYIAFFDDDAVVDKYWLHNLLQHTCDEDLTITTGPQLSIFEEGCPEWAKDIVYFNPRRFSSGTKLRWAATNNILIPLSIYKNSGVCFDNSLRYSGGSDQCFCMEAKQFGYDIVWVDNAIVKENVPLSRTNFDWVLKRSYRYGSTGFFMHRKEKGLIYAFVLSFLKFIYYFFIGMGKVIFSMPKNKLAKIEGVCFLTRSFGWLSGIFNKKHNEYAIRK